MYCIRIAQIKKCGALWGAAGSWDGIALQRLSLSSARSPCFWVRNRTFRRRPGARPVHDPARFRSVPVVATRPLQLLWPHFVQRRLGLRTFRPEGKRRGAILLLGYRMAFSPLCRLLTCSSSGFSYHATQQHKNTQTNSLYYTQFPRFGKGCV